MSVALTKEIRRALLRQDVIVGIAPVTALRCRLTTEQRPQKR